MLKLILSRWLLLATWHVHNIVKCGTWAVRESRSNEYQIHTCNIDRSWEHIYWIWRFWIVEIWVYRGLDVMLDQMVEHCFKPRLCFCVCFCFLTYLTFLLQIWCQGLGFDKTNCLLWMAKYYPHSSHGGLVQYKDAILPAKEIPLWR